MNGDSARAVGTRTSVQHGAVRLGSEHCGAVGRERRGRMGADGIGKERRRAEPDDDIGAIEAQWRPNDLIQQEVIRTRRHAIQPGVAEPHARQASRGPD